MHLSTRVASFQLRALSRITSSLMDAPRSVRLQICRNSTMPGLYEGNGVLGIVREQYGMWERRYLSISTLRSIQATTKHQTSRLIFDTINSFLVLHIRVPLSPAQVQSLIEAHNFRVIIQPSSLRIFSNEEYINAGAEINEDLSEACLILGIKKMSVKSILPEKSYMFFCHIIKAQEGNLDLLDKIMMAKVSQIR